MNAMMAKGTGRGEEARRRLLPLFVPGTLRKKSGTWHLAENLSKNLRFHKLRFHPPDHSRFSRVLGNSPEKSVKIGSREFWRIPDFFRVSQLTR
jgi:hypothetical protein